MHLIQKPLRYAILMLLSVSWTDSYGQLHKMSSFVRETMLMSENRTNGAKGYMNGNDTEQWMNAFVRTADVSVLRTNGCKLLASFGDIHIATIPVKHLRRLAACPEVLRIEAGRRCLTMNDTAAIMVRMPEVWKDDSQSLLKREGVQSIPQTPPQPFEGYSGTGIVVGLMDIGFDLTHPTFYSSDMQRYRIKALWDQLDCTGGGQAVTGTDTAYVGRQYVGQDALLTLGHSYDGFSQCHGSHTTGTAAGSGAEGKWNYGSTELQSSGVPSVRQSEFQFSGMAPDADICLVANATGNNADSIPSDKKNLYNSTTDILGFKYIFDYADAHGQPCVISFSEGSHPDMYGDDLLYEEVLKSMLGPGRILCASAGNEAYRMTYIHKPIGRQEAGAFVEGKTKNAFFTARSSGHITFRLTFYPACSSPVIKEYNTQQIMLVDDSTVFADTIMIDNREHIVMMASYPSCYNEVDLATELLIMVTDQGSVSKEIPVSITMVGEKVRGEMFSSGGYFALNSIDPQLADCEETHNIHTPAGLDGVICVGAVNSRRGIINYNNEWHTIDWGEIGIHGGFSSVGPSMRGLIKPDVCAPGCSVYSASNSWYFETHPYMWEVIRYFDFDGRKYGWQSNCGTSMSCPVVAGVIATWLQACPMLTPEQAMEAIAATAAKPKDFADYPAVTDERGYTRNCYYGYGVIDAYEGLQYILNNFSGITETSITQHPSPITYDLLGRRVTTLHPGTIYIRNGKKITVR